MSVGGRRRERCGAAAGGLYSSLISEWRRARDAGAPAGLKQPRGRPAADPRDAQIAQLERDKAKLGPGLATFRFVIEVQAKFLQNRADGSRHRASAGGSDGRPCMFDRSQTGLDGGSASQRPPEIVMSDRKARSSNKIGLAEPLKQH